MGINQQKIWGSYKQLLLLTLGGAKKPQHMVKVLEAMLLYFILQGVPQYFAQLYQINAYWGQLAQVSCYPLHCINAMEDICMMEDLFAHNISKVSYLCIWRNYKFHTYLGWKSQVTKKNLFHFIFLTHVQYFTAHNVLLSISLNLME